MKLDLKETGFDGANWNQLAQHRVQSQHDDKPWGSIKKASYYLTS
jgi:hypothetical protein